jgi:hypothetical protein
MPEFIWRGAADLANFRCGRLVLKARIFFKAAIKN